MSEPRLKTELWVQACIRRANMDGIALTIARRGDATSGAMLVKINQRDLGCRVLVETRSSDGARAWLAGTGKIPVEEAIADDYIARSRARDPDLWVMEIDDRAGRLPFEAAIVDG